MGNRASEAGQGRTQIDIHRADRVYLRRCRGIAPGFDRNGDGVGDYDNGLHALWRSEDGGRTWDARLRNDSPDILSASLFQFHFAVRPQVCSDPSPPDFYAAGCVQQCDRRRSGRSRHGLGRRHDAVPFGRRRPAFRARELLLRARTIPTCIRTSTASAFIRSTTARRISASTARTTAVSRGPTTHARRSATAMRHCVLRYKATACAGAIRAAAWVRHSSTQARSIPTGAATRAARRTTAPGSVTIRLAWPAGVMSTAATAVSRCQSGQHERAVRERAIRFNGQVGQRRPDLRQFHARLERPDDLHHAVPDRPKRAGPDVRGRHAAVAQRRRRGELASDERALRQ